MNPFEEEPEKKEPGNKEAVGRGETGDGQPAAREKKPARVKGARRVTYSAAAAAIGTVCFLVSVYLPLKIVPLAVTAFCFYLVFERCGAGYGFLTEAVTLLLDFFVSGIAVNVTFLLLAFVFVPYAPVAYLMRSLRYNKARQAAIRAVVVAAFVNLAFFCVFELVTHFVFEGVDIPDFISRLGGYWVIVLIITPVAVSVDFLFTQMALTVGKLIK